MIIMLPIHSFPRTHTHIHHDPLMLTRYDRNVVRHAARPSPEKVKVEELPPWINEPERVDDLLKLYNIEAKVPGRTAGTTLYLVSATRRDGTTDARKKLQCILGFPGLGVGMALVLRINFLLHSAVKFQHWTAEDQTVANQEWKLFLVPWTFENLHDVSVTNVINSHSISL